MKGFIVCGYPGVGKSSIGGWNNCVDLESSYFSRRDDANASQDSDWVRQYVSVAMNLAQQGYTVLISTHIAVIDRLKEIATNIPVFIFCPQASMKEEWEKRLDARCEKSGSEKDKRALHGAIEYWDKKIAALENSGFPVYSPWNLNYDLRDFITNMRHEVKYRPYFDGIERKIN